MKPTQTALQAHSYRTSARALRAPWAVLISALVLAAHLAGAATYTWINTTSDSYTNPASWDLNAVPGSADLAQMAANGTALVDSTMNPLLSQIYLGGLDGTSGNVTMSGGTFSITNNSTANIFLLGYGQNSSGTFTLNGGTLTVARPSTGTRYFQDGFQPGFTIGSTGTVTVNNGTLNVLCGMEIGIDGTGIVNVNGGTLLANGWFTVGRGGTYGAGFYNQTGGTAYHLRNPSTDSKVRIQYAKGINGTFTLSGGTFYCCGISLCANNAVGTATLNISGGNLYLSELGIGSGNFSAGQSQSVNISGGTFHTVQMDANSTGQSGLSSVHVGGPGTNWTWAAANQPTVNLTNSPGPGVVTFAPEAGKTITLNNVWGGPGAMAITGPGTLVMGATNTYTGGTTVSGGTLQLNVNQPASFFSGLVVNSGGTLSLATAELSSPLGAATFNSGSTLSLANGAQVVDSTLTLPSGVNLAFTANNTQYLPNPVAGAGNVVAAMSGNGMEVVTGNLAHTGGTLVRSGILAVGGTLNSSSGVLVTNTGTLAGSGTIGSPIIVSNTTLASAHLRMGNSPMNVPGTLTVNNLTLGFGSEVDFKLGPTTTVDSGVNDLLVVQGNLTIDPNAYVNVIPMQGLAPGSYVLITYSGTLTGQFTNTVLGLTRYGMALDYSTPGQIKLNVTGSNANLTWLGTTNTSWDVLTTSNWLNGASVSLFAEGDAVTFDDTPTNHNVALASTLYPASITFNNSSNYSVTGTGSGRISGATGITKNGTGTVLLAAGLGLGNDYTGPVNLNNGILKLNGALSLGATNGATLVASGATLDLNGQAPNDEPLVLQGAGFGGTNGAINNSSTTAPSTSGGPRKVTLAGDTTLNASGARWDMGLNTLGAGGGYFVGNGHKLTKNGAQQIWMHELGDIGVSDILVNQGTLGFQYTIGMGDPSKTTTVMPGATLGIWHAANPLSKQVVLTNGATLYSDGETGTSNALNGTITLYGANTLQVNQSLGLLSPIVGTGGFTKIGSGPLYLPAANTYSGSTLVNAGSLVLGPSGSIANSAQIALATNTTLDASLPAGGLSLGSGQTLSGSGTVNGNTSAGTGAQIAPGTVSSAGTLTFNNNLTLNGATNVIKLGSDPSTIGTGVNDLVNVAGTLTLNGVSTLAVSPLGVLSTTSPYFVMQYGSGSPSAANLRVVSTSPRYNVSLVDPATTAPYVQVTLTGNPGLLVWKGGAASKPNVWDNTTANWLNLGTGLLDAYFGGDQAILDDTGTTNLINLTTAAVGSLTLSNNTKAYTLTGNGAIVGTLDMEGTSSLRLALSNAPGFSTITANSGTLIFDIPNVAAYTNAAIISDNGLGQGTLVKAGTNTLVLSSPGSSFFFGALVISNGILQYTNALALGGSGSIYVTNTGSLDIHDIPSGSKTVVISGNGFNGQGAVMDSSPNAIANEGVHNLILAGDAGISASNRWDIYGGIGGALNGNGYKLTHLGGTILINAVGETYLGDIRVVAGRLGFQGYATMGDTSKTLTVESNAVLTLYDVSPNVSKNLVMNGGAIFDAAGNGAGDTFDGPVTLVGTSNLFGLRKDLHLSATVSGPGGLTAGDSPVGAGTGTLYLDGNNTYTGPTFINSGHALVVGANSSLGASSRIQVNSGATLDVAALAALTLGAGQSLLGAGIISNSSAIFSSGATLAPGLPDNNTYTLTMSGNLTLQPGSTNLVVVKKGTSVANATVAGLTSVTLGGTLVINSVGNPLAGGDAIPLFSASSGYSGSFNTILPATPGASLAWDTSTLNTDGTLRVVQTGPPTTPTNIVFSVSGNSVKLSWPANYTGWALQAQTNAPGVGLTTTWTTVPGSTTTNVLFMPIDSAAGSVFYRMLLQP